MASELAKKYIRAAVKAGRKIEVIGKNEGKQILAKSFALYDTAWRTVWSSLPRTIKFGQESAQCRKLDLQPGIQKILSTFTDLVKYCESVATRLEKRSKNDEFTEQQRKRLASLAKTLRKRILETSARHKVELAKIPANTLQCSSAPVRAEPDVPRTQ